MCFGNAVEDAWKRAASQPVCGGAECQRKRRTEYHRSKIASDPEYRDGGRDSPRKWRSRNPDYWKRYRQQQTSAIPTDVGIQGHQREPAGGVTP